MTEPHKPINPDKVKSLRLIRRHCIFELLVSLFLFIFQSLSIHVHTIMNPGERAADRLHFPMFDPMPGLAFLLINMGWIIFHIGLLLRKTNFLPIIIWMGCLVHTAFITAMLIVPMICTSIHEKTITLNNWYYINIYFFWFTTFPLFCYLPISMGCILYQVQVLVSRENKCGQWDNFLVEKQPE